MPLVAGVYLNRLRKRWRLEADPTVQFALGFWKKRILYKDLKIDSPFNTYKYFGLPPGPICSPGLASLTAALLAQQTDAMYFISNGDGTHSFFKTLMEHNKKKVARRSQDRKNDAKTFR